MSNPIIENSAKAVIIQDNSVLLIRYNDSSDMRLGTWYALPGGRQRFGETLEETLLRECEEELGAKVSVGRLIFVREYIHARHGLAGTGRDQHKIELMFLCSLESELRDAPESDPDQESAEWVKLGQLPDIKIFPTNLHHLQQLIGRSADDPYWGDVY
jgi:ADP-ribose pyrophosphatase YjhB (NUDIX family)